MTEEKCLTGAVKISHFCGTPEDFSQLHKKTRGCEWADTRTQGMVIWPLICCCEEENGLK